MVIWDEVWRFGFGVGQPTKDKQYFVRGPSFVFLVRIQYVQQWPKVTCDPAEQPGIRGEADQKLGSWARW